MSSGAEHEVHRIAGHDLAQSPAIDCLTYPVPGRFQIGRELRPGNLVILDDQHMRRDARRLSNVLILHAAIKLTIINNN